MGTGIAGLISGAKFISSGNKEKCWSAILTAGKII